MCACPDSCFSSLDDDGKAILKKKKKENGKRFYGIVNTKKKFLHVLPTLSGFHRDTDSYLPFHCPEIPTIQHSTGTLTNTSPPHGVLTNPTPYLPTPYLTNLAQPFFF